MSVIDNACARAQLQNLGLHVQGLSCSWTDDHVWYKQANIKTGGACPVIMIVEVRAY
jgi:hypothetical protein